MPIGSNFDDFLDSEGCREEVEAAAFKRVLVWKIQQSMDEKGLNKTQMAKKMQTSRPAIDRLLDPDNTSITLQTAVKAAQACNMKLTLDLVPT
ncbi:MAG: helix-turn-helix domain-containing protein [Psychrosphaera sp.]|nr:helix-turn-helix domain-containing protein [Psychrosphaera sp.]